MDRRTFLKGLVTTFGVLAGLPVASDSASTVLGTDLVAESYAKARAVDAFVYVDCIVLDSFSYVTDGPHFSMTPEPPHVWKMPIHQYKAMVKAVEQWKRDYARL
jgi:hypothetical protein